MREQEPVQEQERPIQASSTVPELGIVPSRSIAISAGDHRIAVMREVRRVLAESRDHPLQAAKVGLERLNTSQLITAQERSELEQICNNVFAAQRGEMNSEEAFARVRVIYDRMLANSTTSPVGLAIASIASSGSITALPTNIEVPGVALAAISRSDKVDMGIVGGAIVGGAVGGAIGGGGGAIVGAVVGGIVGGVATACATEEDQG